MLSIIKSMSLIGLEGYLVNIEIDVSAGIPCWDIVGLPDASVKEAKERVRTAIKNSGYDMQSRKIVVNLSPADIKKEGSFFDLPIAIGILACSGNINKKSIEDTIFICELSLDGKSLIEVVNFLNYRIHIESTKFDLKKLFHNREAEILDFSEVKGQENIKRALEIAAAGGHNCLLIGSPGSGKTMLARRVPSILPDLTFEESLETTKIHSIAGILEKNVALITKRPFRSPHHTVSSISLIGGGRIPKPGEISLAHNGVLFLDELPEFNKNTLEVLRGPLEDKVVTISRINASLTYPCNFMFIASMNPCPCGYLGSREKECSCSEQSISRYIGKISGPLLDRIDIQIEVSQVKYQNLENNTKIETSQEVKKRVNDARKIQQDRYKKEKIYSNSALTPKLIEKYCKLDSKGKQILELAFNRLGLSARAYGRILKVARTIADLANEKNILKTHVAEAVQYRNLDKRYFKN